MVLKHVGFPMFGNRPDVVLNSPRKPTTVLYICKNDLNLTRRSKTVTPTGTSFCTINIFGTSTSQTSSGVASLAAKSISVKNFGGAHPVYLLGAVLRRVFCIVSGQSVYRAIISSLGAFRGLDFSSISTRNLSKSLKQRLLISK
jgi:hypothetical protein